MTDEERKRNRQALENSLEIALQDLGTLKELWLKTRTHNFPNKYSINKNIYEGIVYAAVNIREWADKLQKF